MTLKRARIAGGLPLAGRDGLRWRARGRRRRGRATQQRTRQRVPRPGGALRRGLCVFGALDSPQEGDWTAGLRARFAAAVAAASRMTRSCEPWPNRRRMRRSRSRSTPTWKRPAMRVRRLRDRRGHCSDSPSREKKTFHATERETERVRRLKDERWGTLGDVPIERVVFIDEAGCNTVMARRYARSSQGRPAHVSQPFGWAPNVTRIGALSLEGCLLAAIPARLQPHRALLVQGQDVPPRSGCTHSRGS
jgi:hypothetical protein